MHFPTTSFLNRITDIWGGPKDNKIAPNEAQPLIVPTTTSSLSSIGREEGSRHRARLENRRVWAKLFSVAAGKEKLRAMSLFRGMTTSSGMDSAIYAMVKGEPTKMPFIWGFREYDPRRDGLEEKEINTLDAYAEGVKKLNDAGFKVTPMLLLADSHAVHNKVPAMALPEEEGGNGFEGHMPYLRKVEEEAEARGIKTIYLSKVFAKLGIDPHDIATAGREIVEFADETTTPDKSKKIRITQEELTAYMKQAQHMVERYPTVPENKQILQWLKEGKDGNAKSAAAAKEALKRKAKEYIIFRAGEGEMLLPHLGTAISEDGTSVNVLPAHGANPEAEKINVWGVYLYSRTRKNENSNDICWKGGRFLRKYKEGKFTKAQAAAANLVTRAIKGKHGGYGVEGYMLSNIAKNLSDQGYTGDALVAKARDDFATAMTEHKARNAAKIQRRIEWKDKYKRGLKDELKSRLSLEDHLQRMQKARDER